MAILVPNGCRSLIDDATAQKWCDALQRQIANDFAPHWHRSDVVHYVGDSDDVKPQDGDCILRLVTTASEPGNLGEHWLDGTVPTGDVGVQTCIDDGVKPSSCFSHEGLEILGDPYGNLCYQVGNFIWAGEVCDRVEDSDASYLIDGVLVENFNLPAAFYGGPGPWDFRGKCASNVVLPNGYQLQIDLSTGKWSQITGALARKSKLVAGLGSRRASRIVRAGGDPSALVLVAA